MIVSDLIRASLRKIGALSLGEGVLDIEEIPGLVYTDLLQTLQVMLRSWAQHKILIFASTKESITLVPSQSLYTWGSSGNINSDRPHKILNVFIRDFNNTDSFVNIISENEYNNISSKTTLGRPNCLFYHPKFPLGNVYLYPTPQITESLFITSLKPFIETSSIDDISSTLAFPPNYEEAIIYNYAVRIAPDNGISVSPEVAMIADSSYRDLTGLNSSNQVEPVRLSIPGGCCGGSGSYNINRGY